MDKCQFCNEDLPETANLCPNCGHFSRRGTSGPFTSTAGDKVLGFLLSIVLMGIVFSGLIIVPVTLILLREKRPDFCWGLLVGTVTTIAVVIGIFVICTVGIFYHS